MVVGRMGDSQARGYEMMPIICETRKTSKKASIGPFVLGVRVSKEVLMVCICNSKATTSTTTKLEPIQTMLVC
jgi:hypothetical protein